MEGRNLQNRVLIVIALLCVLAITCVIRLFNLQIIHGETYRNQAEQRLLRAYPIKAARGEIVDRYGQPFLENRMGYVVQIQDISLDNDALNEEIVQLSRLVESQGKDLVSDFPIFYDDVNEYWGFTFTEGKESREQIKEVEKDSKEAIENGEEIDQDAAQKLREQQQGKLQEWKEEKKLTQYESAQQIASHYRQRYGVASQYDDADTRRIIAVRYDMEQTGFSQRNPYILARDVGEIVLQQIKEQSMNYPGVEVEIEPVRVYAQGNTAAHILGRVGKIYAEEYQELKSRGYGMNDTIGKEGLEKKLESYLRGTDGYKSVSMSRSGGVTEILQSQAAKPGNYARLSLDLDLQLAMEKALQEHITAAVDRNGAGAAIAIIPNTGEVLATASYPSFHPETFNADYDKLAKAKSKPLINRVFNGTYSPGSTFKPLTAIAGLETGEIEPNTYILDKGKYTYFDSYQPTCLIYSSSGATHGSIEVSEALGVSCNYFFYEVGRRVGIENLEKYAKLFGLGENTGIEVPESLGLMASPKHREEIGAEWYPGDVIQAAIGQSDNLFTPAQLANYIATFLNKGRRYRLHMVNEIVDYETKEVKERYNPVIEENFSIKDSTFAKVKEGMRQVVAEGTAKSAFVGSKYVAAGKTGTAEVPDGADNVLFVGFAPYDSPEIVVAVVIEHGASSTYAAKIARDIFDAYMELKEERADPDYKEKKKQREKEKEKERQEAMKNDPEASNKPQKTAGPVPTATSQRGQEPVMTESPENNGDTAIGEGTL